MSNISSGRALPLLIVLLFVGGMFLYGEITKISTPGDDSPRDLKTTYPTLAYQALFVQESSAGKAYVIVSCDGEGHLRIKEKAPYLLDSRITIVDYLKEKKYYLTEHNKTYQTARLTNMEVGIFDEQVFKFLKSIKLGIKDLGGVRAEGWRTKLPIDDDKQIEAWYAEKTGCLLLAKGKGITTTLLKFQEGKLPKENFELPADFKKTAI
jgi:hypothetical protein